MNVLAEISFCCLLTITACLLIVQVISNHSMRLKQKAYLKRAQKERQEQDQAHLRERNLELDEAYGETLVGKFVQLGTSGRTLGLALCTTDCGSCPHKHFVTVLKSTGELRNVESQLLSLVDVASRD